MARVFFFLLWPLFARAPRHWFLENFLLSAPGVQSVFFFCCAPLGAATFRRGQSKKKNTMQGVFFFLLWVVFFFLLWPRAGTGLLLPLPFRGAGAKKNTLGGVFFFCCGPARTLTHSLRDWVAMPPPRRGVCFFFLLRPRPHRGGVFFFCCGPARALTHSLWAGAISARPGWCFFFCCGPAGSF